MAGPKHLWSGDWEHDSAQAAEELTIRLPTEPEQDLPAAPAPARRPRRRLTLRQLAACLAAFVVVGVGLAVALGHGGSRRHSHRPTTPALTILRPTTPPNPGTSTGPSGGIGLTQPSAPTRVANTPSANWMGMHIVTSPLGAVVSTVAARSGGQAAGIQPGDVITAIDNDATNSATQIRAAVAKITLGNRLEITIERGSTILTTAATLRNRPTIQP